MDASWALLSMALLRGGLFSTSMGFPVPDLTGGWQIKVLRGAAMRNPDGSVDDWHEQKTHYGIAFADVFLACPAGIVGILLIFIAPRGEYYLLGLERFWFV